MSNIDPPAGWDDVPELLTNQRALAGPGGPMNVPLIALTARTKQLSDWRDEDLAAVLADKETLASAVGAALVGYKQPEASAASMTVANKLGQWVAPEDWGAVTGAVGGIQATVNALAISNCLAAASARRVRAEFSGGTYYTDVAAGPLRFPSNCTVMGNGSRLLKVSSNDGPLAASVSYLDDAAPAGRLKVRDLAFIGNGSGVNEHTFVFRDYYSDFDGCSFENHGGRGLFFSHLGATGGTVTGTLVENRVLNCASRLGSRSGFYLGASNNAKFTDGYLQNCVVRAAAGSTESLVVVGSFAGWDVSGLHTYGGSPASAVTFANGFNSQLSCYVEDGWTQYAIDMPNYQGDCKLDTLIVMGGSVVVGANAAALRISRSSAVTTATLSVGSLSVAADTGSTLLAIRNENAASVFVSLANLVRSRGNGTVTLPGATDAWFTGPVETLRAVGARKQLLYQNFGVPMSNTVAANGTGVKTCTFEIPWIGLSSQVVVDITISARTNNNGALAATFRGYAVINSKALADAWVVNLQTVLLLPIGAFSTAPTATVSNTGQSGTLTVTFEYMAGTNAFGSCHFLLQQSGL